MEIDMVKSKREDLRWQILVTLNAGRPDSVPEHLITQVVCDVVEVTPLQLRRELDYLQERGLVKITSKGTMWFAELTRDGMDIVEYTVDCDPGIARPRKYW